MTLRDWRDAIVAGAAVGAIVLGVGGRLTMRAYALWIQQDPSFSIGGSATVVAVGAVSGAAAGAIAQASRALFPARAVLRHALFWGSCLLLMPLVLRTTGVFQMALFSPVVMVFGVLLELALALLRPWRTAV